MADDGSRLGRLRLILLDVDGVLTDGRIGFMDGGGEIKFFHVRDGLAIRRAQAAGLRVGFLSGRRSAALRARARELGVEIVIEGSHDKKADFRQLRERLNLEPREIAYVGDDLPDLDLFDHVGFSAAPADAAAEVRARADYVSSSGGGHGAVRDIIDHLLGRAAC